VTPVAFSGEQTLTISWPSARAGWYATLILTLAYTFSFVDRQILNLLVDPIKLDLELTDTRVSFLQGFAFALPYIVMSIPVGRLVDRVNRIFVLVGGVIIWTGATLASGLSQNYGQLMAARMVVGSGEASVSPAAWSLLADFFPPDRLALPTSIFLMGPYLGGGLALMGGASAVQWFASVDLGTLPVVGELAAWQFTFIAVAIPGLLIGFLLPTIKNPPRQKREAVEQDANNWGDVWKFLRSRARIYIAVLLGVPFTVVVLYGLQGWVPSMLVRVYGWDIPTAGWNYGLLALIAGSGGVLLGPVIGKYLLRRGHPDYPLRIGAAGALGIMVSMSMLPFQDDAFGALVCIGFASFFVALPLALMTYIIQIVSPPNMRGVIAGMYVATSNILGLALGPTLVAAATDYIFQDPAQVHLSLTLVSVIVAPIAFVLLASGMKPLADWHRENAMATQA
jgi:MFS family permease